MGKVKKKGKRSDSVLWQKSLHRTKQSKKQRDNTYNNAIKNLDYITITDRLRTVSLSNNSHPTGVVKPVYERSAFPLIAMFSRVIKRAHI